MARRQLTIENTVAAELAGSEDAVLKSLEGHLEVDLFLRGNRTLTLTAAGAAYLPQVRAALEMIVGASNAVPGRKPTGRLAVSVSPTFGVRWLLPRLVRFSDRHPDIEVSVDTGVVHAHRQARRQGDPRLPVEARPSGDDALGGAERPPLVARGAQVKVADGRRSASRIDAEPHAALRSKC